MKTMEMITMTTDETPTRDQLRTAIIQLNKINNDIKSLLAQKSELEQKLTTLPNRSYTVTGDDGTGLRLDIKRTYRLDLHKVQDKYTPQAHPDFYKLTLNTRVIRAAVSADELKECETPSKAYTSITEIKK